MRFVIGLRQAVLVPVERALDVFRQKQADATVRASDVVKKKRGKKHEHRCSQCYKAYPCKRNESCSGVKLGICDDCLKKL